MILLLKQERTGAWSTITQLCTIEKKTTVEQKTDLFFSNNSCSTINLQPSWVTPHEQAGWQPSVQHCYSVPASLTVWVVCSKRWRSIVSTWGRLSSTTMPSDVTSLITGWWAVLTQVEAFLRKTQLESSESSVRGCLYCTNVFLVTTEGVWKDFSAKFRDSLTHWAGSLTSIELWKQEISPTHEQKILRQLSQNTLIRKKENLWPSRGRYMWPWTIAW